MGCSLLNSVLRITAVSKRYKVSLSWAPILAEGDAQQASEGGNIYTHTSR